MKKTIYYPPVGISHMLNSVIDLMDIDIDTKLVVINTSSQPNSEPHLGTLITLMVSFALAKKIKLEKGIKSMVEFDELENSPIENYDINGIKYCKALSNVYIKDKSMAEINMHSYINIFENLKILSGIDYSVRTYKKFQSSNTIRKGLKKIIKNIEFFKILFNNNNNSLHIRVPCPICNLMDKNNTLTNIDLNSYILTIFCPIHGKHSVNLMDTSSYIDLNTQLRDLLKSVEFLERANERVTIMCDGSDWSGNWDRRVNIEGLLKLGYTKLNKRIFSPLILDWSGAKFSKSMYIKNENYREKYLNIINYSYFINTYGMNGFKKLWIEVNNWINDPKKFFRNYSIEYIYYILES